MSVNFEELWSKRNDIAQPTEQPAEQSASQPAPEQAVEESAPGQEPINADQGSQVESLSASEVTDNLSQEQQPSQSVDVEKLFVKGPNNQRQEIQVDYSDKAKIKDAYVRAAGMRKFQVERDEARKSVKEMEEKYNKVSSMFTKLEQAYEEGGLKGMAFLLGGEKLWKQAIQSELEEQERRANMTAQERYELERKERDAYFARQLENETKRRKEFEQKIAQTEEQAALKNLEAKFVSSFDKYRYAGKLGDTDAENELDETLWTRTRQKLKAYLEETNQDESALTPAVIDKAFRDVASTYNKFVSKQAAKTVDKIIDKNKQQAMEKAQTMARKGLSQNQTSQQTIVDKLKSGDLNSAFSMWFQNR